MVVGTGDWHALASDAAAGRLRTNAETGLSSQEARRRFAQQGPNELPEVPPPSPFALFCRQFASLVIWVLIVAAVVSGFLQEWIDAAAILAIVLLNALLGFVQEFKAERSLAARDIPPGGGACISHDGVRLPAYVVAVDEETAIARGARLCLGGEGAS